MCDVCSKAFSHKHNLLDHQRLHLGLKPFLCEICCKAFNHKAKMVNHMRTHTGEKPFQCEVCPKTFASKFGMTKHQKVHRTREAKAPPGVAVGSPPVGSLMYESLVAKDKREQDYYAKLKADPYAVHRNIS